MFLLWPGRPPDPPVPGRRHVAAPGEPRCPAPDCERPAGFATAHVGEGPCRRHDSHSAAQLSQPVPPEPIPEPESEPRHAPGPLARRLTGSRAAPTSPDPLAVLRTVLASARRAGYPFGEAWSISAEVALSYMGHGQAREWWEALDATERAWAQAYAREGSRLAELRRF